MNELSTILKMIGYFLLIPIIIAVPLAVFGKFTNIWLEASTSKKDKISLSLSILVILYCFIQIVTATGNSAKQSISAAIILLVISIHFSAKELRKQGDFKMTTLSGQKSEVVELGIKGAWRSQYHWGTVVQIVSLIYCIYAQI